MQRDTLTHSLLLLSCCVASSFEGFDSTRLDIIRLLCVRQAYRDAVESAALYCALAALLLLADHLA